MPVYGSQGRYWIRYEAPRGMDGRRRQIVRRGFRTKKDAQEAERSARAEVDSGLAPERARLPLSEYLAQWLEMVRARVSARTLASYEDVCRIYLRPQIGALRMGSVTGLHVERMLAVARERKVSELRVRYVYRVLAMAMRRAVLLRIIPYNPCDGVPSPRPGQREPRVLTADQAVELLASCAGTWLYLPVLLSMTCGLRRGEVTALRWSDLDIDGGYLVVRRAAELLHGQVTMKDPKTHQSASVAIPGSVLDDLRLARAAAAPGDGYIVCEPDGGLTRPDLLTDRFRRHVKRIGMDIHFHGLRHTQGTLLLSAGVPDRIAMARMRHRTKEMMHLYAHVLPPMRDGAAEQIDRALGRSRDAM